MNYGAASLPKMLSSRFSDLETLKDLTTGRISSPSEISRRLFTAARARDTQLPDHVYHAALSTDSSRPQPEVWDLPFSSHTGLAGHLLERRSGMISVRPSRFEAWQDITSIVSPLSMAVAFLVDEGRSSSSVADPRRFLEDELGGSALFRPFVPGLWDLEEREGLHEMHMHLNGSTEADAVWAHAMREPRAYLAEIRRAHSKEAKVRELLAEVEPGLTPSLLHRRLRAVRRARHLIAARLTAGNLAASPAELARALDAVVPDGLVDDVCGMPLHRPPSEMIYGRVGGFSPVTEEAAFLFRCFSTATASDWKPTVGVCLHASALLFAQLSRLAVHHPSQTGFEQFQKLTLAGTRETLERHYRARFDQLSSRRPIRGGSHLEGRFAPKSAFGVTAALVKAIADGYLSHIGCRRRLIPDAGLSRLPACLTPAGCPAAESIGPSAATGRELALVAHFIKRRSSDAPLGESGASVARARFSTLRRLLAGQARDLRHLVQRFPLAAHLLQGIDAAGNELDTPPEVFAPCFRMLRNDTVAHATYHVGEDFRHLTSGIRAVVEAISYLELGPGDRVGHATAIGIDPALWLRRFGPGYILPAEDALDDAVFAYRILSEAGRSASASKLVREMSGLSSAVYGRELSPALLDAAWRLRSLDALEVVALAHARDVPAPAADPAGFGAAVLQLLGSCLVPARAGELRRNINAAAADPAAYEVAASRHGAEIRRRGAKMISREHLLDADDLAELQEHALAAVRQAGVVIEALPTSNVRISFYREYKEHHIFRWLGFSGPALRTRPDVCIGSDDPGIFATSLPNEYTHLYEVMVHELGLTEAGAISALRHLNDVGRVHRFRTR